MYQENETVKLELESLIPNEPAVIRQTYESYKELIESGQPIKPIKVVRVDDYLLVTDGNHRCKAFRNLGHKTIQAKLDEVPREAELNYYREFVIPWRIENNQTFENLKILENELERERLIIEEYEQMRSTVMWRRLKERL